MKTHALRLRNGNDLKQSLDQLALEHGWSAACVQCCVGSLTKAVIRYANQEEAAVLEGHFEILSLNGTLSRDGSHLHICIADEQGNTIGGHLKEGSTVYTTAEIVLSILDAHTFRREIDLTTGYLELSIAENEVV